MQKLRQTYISMVQSLDGTKLQYSQKYRKHSETNKDYLSFSSDTQQINMYISGYLQLQRGALGTPFESISEPYQR